MTKIELAKCLELGGSFTFEVGYTPFSEVHHLAESVAKSKGKGVLTLVKTDRLRPTEIMCLCETAPGQIVFPDAEVR